jgi:hypothetical protein
MFEVLYMGYNMGGQCRSYRNAIGFLLAQRLSEILDIEKITDLSGEAIIKLWNTHFSEMKDKPYIHATISPEAYAVFATKAATCPMVRNVYRSCGA